MADNDLTDTIAQNAAGPAKAASDGTSMEQHSLRDQVIADRYLASKAAMGKRNFGLTRVKIIPPGTV